MKLTEIILQATAPAQTRAMWAKPSDNGIVELKVFNNGQWQDTVVTPDLSPYLKTTEFNQVIVDYLLKTDAESLYQPKGDYALRNEIPSLDGYVTDTSLESTLQDYVTGDSLSTTLQDYATSQSVTSGLSGKEDLFTVGTGLEMTEDRVLNVTLDTTVFYVAEALPVVPDPGNENKICLVPTDNVSTLAPDVGNSIKNEYTEYIWTGSSWEELGKYYSEVDLTPYLKSADAANTYLSKTDASSTYLNKTDASSTYLSKTDAASTYETTEHASVTYATATNLNSAVSRITALENKQTVVTEVPTLTAAYTIPANATMVEKIYMITIGATVYDVTGATGIKWAGGVTPSVSANSILVVSVLNNLATWQTFI